MPLLDALSQKERQHMKLRGMFEELPETDKAGVIELVKMGKRTVAPEAMALEAAPELSEQGKAFVDHGLFREVYDINTHREPPPPTNMAGSELKPVLRGLMEVISILKDKKGMLDPDNSNRVGAPDIESSKDISKRPKEKGATGFEDELGTAFKEGGPRALALAHRELLRDPEYTKFLKGGK
jgi:hypothetical protein